MRLLPPSCRIRIHIAAAAAGVIGLVAGLAVTAGPLPEASAGPADPILPQQWSLAKIGAADAWATSTGQGVVVAVVDSGVDFGHEDLRGQSAGSFTCVGSCTEGGGDVQGHGTAVASVIAAASNNGIGIASVAPGARVLSVRVLDETGGGTVGDVSQGIRFAADRGAKVVNISIGTDLDLPIVFGLLAPDLQNAVSYAWGKGAVVVAAAGNGGLASSYTGMANLLVVGATGPEDEVASYSSSLTGVSIYAPGGDHQGDRCTAIRCITAAESPNIYRAVEGTSFAAPHVSGVAAQLAAMGLSNADIAARIRSTADRIPAGIRLNAARAVGAPQGGAPPPPPPAPQTAATTPNKPKAAPVQAPSPLPSPAASPSPSPSVEPSPSPTPSAPSPVARAAGSPDRSGSDRLKIAVAAGLVLAMAAGGGVFALIRRRG